MKLEQRAKEITNLKEEITALTDQVSIKNGSRYTISSS